MKQRRQSRQEPKQVSKNNVSTEEEINYYSPQDLALAEGSQRLRGQDHHQHHHPVLLPLQQGQAGPQLRWDQLKAFSLGRLETNKNLKHYKMNTENNKLFLSPACWPNS